MFWMFFATRGIVGKYRNDRQRENMNVNFWLSSVSKKKAVAFKIVSESAKLIINDGW